MHEWTYRKTDIFVGGLIHVLVDNKMAAFRVGAQFSIYKLFIYAYSEVQTI